nr:HlyD family efflux transporter periplasmic adaptor subunit [Pseudopedobacter sp.]
MPHIEEHPIHSEEVEEIITDTPPWILRWGLTVFFGVLIGIVICAAFIRMPDKINGKLRIESTNQPEEIIPHSSGKLTALFVKENTLVDSGAILGYIESNAHPKQVLDMSLAISHLQQLVVSNELDRINHVYLINPEHLGELQSSYLTFSQSLNEFKSFLSNGFYEQKKISIQEEISDLKLQRTRLSNQQRIYEQDLAIAKRDFDANKKLLDGKVISISEFKKAESSFINKKIPLENVASSYLQNNMSQNAKQAELKDLDNQVKIQKENFLAKVNQFKSELDNWRHEHILEAKSSGKVVFNRFIRQGDFVEVNKPLFYIKTKNAGTFEGEMRIGQYALGKVKEGQNVIIRLSAFPYQEYGVLKGKISYLSNQTINDSIYIARVTFLDSGKTSYHKNLNLKNGLLADAEIITQKRSLLTKLFNSVYTMFKNE